MNGSKRTGSSSLVSSWISTTPLFAVASVLTNSRALMAQLLLELMHKTGTRDSLSYWLEFKNDDEFPSVRVGSIAGGSALKFGVFRRIETGEWQAADKGKYPQDVSVDDAVEIARKHRAQLLQGVNLLEELPDNGGDDDYHKLQCQNSALLK